MSLIGLIITTQVYHMNYACVSQHLVNSNFQHILNIFSFSFKSHTVTKEMKYITIFNVADIKL